MFLLNFPHMSFIISLLAHMVWAWCTLALGAKAPYPVLCYLGTRIGAMARPFLKRRESIARKNTELCFRSILRKNARR